MRGDLADAFPQIMEKQNTLKAKTASILDSLLQADVAALKRQQQVTYWPCAPARAFLFEVIMEQYLIYLRKSRSDLEAEAHGEGETLSRHEHTLLELAKRQHLNVTDIYREVVSGDTIAARPMMQRVLSEVEQGRLVRRPRHGGRASGARRHHRPRHHRADIQVLRDKNNNPYKNV